MFFFQPMLSRKTFTTNSLVQKFLLDVWFGRDANYSKIKSTPMYPYSSIDGAHQMELGCVFVGHTLGDSGDFQTSRY